MAMFNSYVKLPEGTSCFCSGGSYRSCHFHWAGVSEHCIRFQDPTPYFHEPTSVWLCWKNSPLGAVKIKGGRWEGFHPLQPLHICFHPRFWGFMLWFWHTPTKSFKDGRWKLTGLQHSGERQCPIYPLVNEQLAMDNYHFLRGNSS